MNAKQMFGSENAYRMKTVKTMTCPHCKTLIHQGTGQFATDYLCDVCGQMYNYGGQEVRWVEDDYD